MRVAVHEPKLSHSGSPPPGGEPGIHNPRPGCRVEERRGGLESCDKRSVSPPRSSNRTCGFPASGSPTGFAARPTTVRSSPCRKAPLRASRGFSGVARLIANHRLVSPFGKHARSEDPSLHRHYSVSAVLRSSPTPVWPAVHVTALGFSRPRRVSPAYPQHLSNVPCPIPRWTEAGASVGFFPVSRGLPRSIGGSASTTSLSRPAQASLSLRPAGLLSRLTRPLSQGFDQASYPTEPLVSYQSYRLLSGWFLPPLVLRALGAHYGFRARHLAVAPRNDWTTILPEQASLV